MRAPVLVLWIQFFVHKHFETLGWKRPIFLAIKRELRHGSPSTAAVRHFRWPVLHFTALGQDAATVDDVDQNNVARIPVHPLDCNTHRGLQACSNIHYISTPNHSMKTEPDLHHVS